MVIVAFILPVSISAQPQATVSVDPEYTTVEVGETFTINITATQLTDVMGYSFRLMYNSSEMSLIDITAGDYLSACGTPVPNYIDEKGLAGMDSACMGAIVSSGTTLAVITFETLMEGTSILAIMESTISIGKDTNESNDAVITAMNGSVNAYSITVSVEPSTQETIEGKNFTINITAVPQKSDIVGYSFRLTYDSSLINVTNIVEGDYLSTCNLTFPVYIDEDSIVGIDNVCVGQSVTPGSILAMITFDAIVLGNTSLELSDVVVSTSERNILPATTNGEVIIGRYNSQGDITGDGTVSFDDLLVLAVAYDTEMGNERYDDSADCNGDGKVDFQDLLILAVNYQC